MKILVICQHYYPEPFRLPDICEEFIKRGHDVSVIAQIPNYPMGEFYDGYNTKTKRDEIINGVKVHRCFTIPRKTGFLYRVLNYYSFSISSTLYVKKIKEEYDVVFVNQLSPVMMANAGIKYKKKHNKKLVLYCMDLWPESLTYGGIKKDSLIYKLYKNVSKRIYKSADKLLVTSNSFKDYFEKMFGIKKQEIGYLPQYAESLFDKESCKRIEDKNINLVFAGNIGKAQSVETIIEAAYKLKDNKKIHFHLVGDGSMYEYCKSKIKELELTNIVMYGRKPIEDMPIYYKMADAMIVTLSGDSEVSNTLPGKVQTYMAAGKPIIASANGETNKIISEANCGYCGQAGNSYELVKNINKFIENENKDKLGNNSSEFYEKYFTKEIFINKLLDELKTQAERGKNE